MSLSRRMFLTRCGGVLGALALEQKLGAAQSMVRMWQMPPGVRTLVLINLEGGYDSLSLLPPRGSTAVGSAFNRYTMLRPQLAWPQSGPTASLPLGGVPDWGLHPQLGFLNTLYGAGDLAIVQKVGLPAPTLSHFRARDIMSRGRASITTTDRRGWVGRLADVAFPNALDIVGVGVGNRVDFKTNSAKPLRIKNLSNFTLGSFQSATDNALRQDILEQMMDQTFTNEHRLVAGMRSTVNDGHEFAQTVQNATAGITLSGTYPLATDEPLGGALADIAKLIKSSLGTRVFYTSTAGFDTHGGQEVSATGSRPTLTQRLQLVMQALQAFVTDLQSPAIQRWNDTAIVLFTEFGRRNYENQTGGTDHGHGFHAFVTGGLVQGGMKGTPITAADIDSGSGYMPVQIDFRTVFKKCLTEWLQLSPAVVAQIFDDFTPSPSEPAFTLF